MDIPSKENNMQSTEFVEITYGESKIQKHSRIAGTYNLRTMAKRKKRKKDFTKVVEDKLSRRTLNVLLSSLNFIPCPMGSHERIQISGLISVD